MRQVLNSWTACLLLSFQNLCYLRHRPLQTCILSVKLARSLVFSFPYFSVSRPCKTLYNIITPSHNSCQKATQVFSQLLKESRQLGFLRSHYTEKFPFPSAWVYSCFHPARSIISQVFGQHICKRYRRSARHWTRHQRQKTESLPLGSLFSYKGNTQGAPTYIINYLCNCEKCHKREIQTAKRNGVSSGQGWSKTSSLRRLKNSERRAEINKADGEEESFQLREGPQPLQHLSAWPEEEFAFIVILPVLQSWK